MNKYERAIEILERRTTIPDDSVSFDDINNAIDVAIKSLRAQAERDDPKPLTSEELRERDGKPVFVLYGDREEGEWRLVVVCGENGINCISADDTEGEDNDTDFYGMTYNDPIGHHGLHYLGWLAYDHPPKEDKHEQY